MHLFVIHVNGNFMNNWKHKLILNLKKLCVVVCSSPVIKNKLLDSPPTGFFLSILLCNHTGNHPQEELAKFGYRSERKVKKFKNPAIIWQPAAGTYCLDMVILFFFNSSKSAHLDSFFSQKCFLWVAVHFILFYLSRNGKNLPKKKGLEEHFMDNGGDKCMINVLN
jgi:hypothetical protein